MQAEGLSHITNLKADAYEIWECYGYQDDYWKQSVLIAMNNHRKFLFEKQRQEELDRQREIEEKRSRAEVESLWDGRFVD